MPALSVDDTLGRATLLEQARFHRLARREAELARLRSISGPQPHRHAPLISVDADAGPHPSAD